MAPCLEMSPGARQAAALPAAGSASEGRQRTGDGKPAVPTHEVCDLQSWVRQGAMYQAPTYM